MTYPKMEVLDHYHQVSEWCKNHQGKPTPWVTMLYGSQNYGLETPESDVDTKTMLLPSLSMLVNDNNRVSKELTMTDGSFDTCKDFRDMFSNYLKGNINFVETLYTSYTVVNYVYRDEWKELQDLRDLIANAQPVKLMRMARGMARQKFVAFDKPFEGKKAVLEKYGYDPKQLHHLVRLDFFMENYLANMNFEKALNCCSTLVTHDFLTGIKTNPYPLDEALKMRESYMDEIEELAEKASMYLPANNGYEDAKEALDALAIKIMRKHLKYEG